MKLSKPYAIIAVVLVICLCCFVVLFGFIVDFSNGGTGPARGGDVISLHNLPFQTTNKTTVELSIGFTPAKGVILYCTYTITDSNHKVVDGSLMLHLPFSSEYIIDKTLTNLANGNYTFIITIHYANGSIHTPENQTFTVDTTFKYPILTVISPQNQTYNTNQVVVIYNTNSKVLMSYYKLDNQDWTFFKGNITLSNLSIGSHTLVLSVVTEANRHIANANEEQTIYFIVNS